MIVYLNRGLILEQAVCSLIHNYFDNLRIESKYKNFHISVTTEHPFAELYLHETLNAADSFPAVVVSTQEDSKPAELSDLPVHVSAYELDKNDIQKITMTRDSDGNEIPGLCSVVDQETLSIINQKIDSKGYVMAVSFRSCHKDNINLEIWTENNQLKNEIYEQLRLYVTGSFARELEQKYPFHAITCEDTTYQGHRSNNYNFDFDAVLYGAHISFDVNYMTEQLLIDTDADNRSSDIITEVINHVK